MKAVFLDYATMGPGLDLDILRDAVSELTVFDVTDDSQMAERIQDVDVVFTNKMQLTPELLSGAPKLKLIGLTATGTDNVDLATAKNCGIAVVNIRDYCTASVVEHVFGVLLMLTHSLNAFRLSVRAGEWQRSDIPFLLSHPIRELSAMTLGIVGFGTLGKGVAEASRTFGMRVVVSARPGLNSASVPPDRVAFDDVLQQSDVISLHCPLNDETRNLIGRNEFERMKDSAILINTARGGLVDSAALVAALKTGQIAAAAIDVLPTEPPVDGDPLLDFESERLVITPHIAWATDEARQNAINELAANTRAFAAGKSRNRVV